MRVHIWCAWVILALCAYPSQGCWMFAVGVGLWLFGIRFVEGPSDDDDLFTDEALAKWIAHG